MATDATRYDVPFRAPTLPEPPATYDRLASSQFNKVLRIYFNKLDNALRRISVDVQACQGTNRKSAYIAGVDAGQTLKSGNGSIYTINLSTINNNASITLYDNTTASGTILWAFDSGGVDRAGSFNFGVLNFDTGVTIVQTGAGTKTTVGYE